MWCYTFFPVNPCPFSLSSTLIAFDLPLRSGSDDRPAAREVEHVDPELGILGCAAMREQNQQEARRKGGGGEKDEPVS